MDEKIYNVVMFIIGNMEIAVMIFGIFCIPCPQRKKISTNIGIVLAAIMIIIELIFPRSNLVEVLGILVCITLWILWSKGSVVRRLAICLCGLFFSGFPYYCINLVASVLIGSDIKTLSIDKEYRIIRGCINILLFLSIALFLRRRKKYREIVARVETKYIIIALIGILAAAFVQYSTLDITQLYGDTSWSRLITMSVIIVSFLFYFFGIGLFLLDYFRKKYKEESNLKGLYLELSKEYTEMVKQNERETRRIRHDIHAHLTILEEFARKKTYDRLTEYLNQILRDYDQRIRHISSVNHAVVDAVLMQAQLQGEKYEINWSVEGTLSESILITDFDLCTMFSNLLSNAVEACAKVQGRNRQIRLEIRDMQDILIIELENSVDEPVDIPVIGEMTTKKDKENHGYGVRNIQETVRKYGGKMEFENREGNCFRIRLRFENL